MTDIIVNAELNEKEVAKLAIMVDCPKCEAPKGKACKGNGVAGKAHFLRLKIAATAVMKKALK